MFPYQAKNMLQSVVKFNMGGSGIYLCLEPVVTPGTVVTAVFCFYFQPLRFAYVKIYSVLRWCPSSRHLLGLKAKDLKRRNTNTRGAESEGMSF